MQWWSRRRPAEQRTLGVAQPLLPTSGVVAPANALAVADVYACVRVLSDAAASCPLIVYRRTEAGRVRVSNRTAELLRHPGPATTQANLISTVVAHLNLWGNAYIGKYRDGDGNVAQLGLLPPDRVTPELVAGEPRYVFRP